MLVAHDRRLHEVAEHVARDQRRQRRVEMLHVGQSAAQHDHVGVEQVDHVRQPARQPVGVPIERRLRARIARGGTGRDAGGVVRARRRRNRAPARGRRSRSPGSPNGRTSNAARGIRPAAARAAGCGPIRR